MEKPNLQLIYEIPHIKYESLGNSFLLLDWYNTESNLNIHDSSWIKSICDWPTVISDLCSRHNTDGILIIYPRAEFIPSTAIFNSDGSDGQISLNGARCIAHHLHKTHGFPKKFSFTMGNQEINTVIDDKSSPIHITQYIKPRSQPQKKTIKIPTGHSFTGHIVDVGNPHFIIFDDKFNQSTDFDTTWLKHNGHFIESHHAFPNKTNVEFVQEEKQQKYKLFVYERGCGITEACSSGAAATTWLLYTQNKIHNDQHITITMPGGIVTTWITQARKSDEQIAIKAIANRINQPNI